LIKQIPYARLSIILYDSELIYLRHGYGLLTWVQGETPVPPLIVERRQGLTDLCLHMLLCMFMRYCIFFAGIVGLLSCLYFHRHDFLFDKRLFLSFCIQSQSFSTRFVKAGFFLSNKV